MRDISHSYLVHSLADLPESFQRSVGQVLKADEPANWIWVIPRHSQTLLKRRRYVPRQALVFTSRGVLHVQERSSPGNPPAATYLRSADLLYASHCLILLYGRLELAGEAHGALARIVVEYNTADQHLMEPALQQFFRLAFGSAQAAGAGRNITDVLLQELDAQSFRFRNGLKLYALRPGEQLLGFVFQPRIVQRIWSVISRPIAPAALLALTDSEVIIITEERSRGASYGWLITWCPRGCIAGIETEPNKKQCEVRVRLARNQVTMDLRVTLENDRALAWEALWSKECVPAQ